MNYSNYFFWQKLLKFSIISEWIKGLEHKNITLEDDRALINKILDDLDMRYIILFLYIIRNDLFNDLIDDTLIESYQNVLSLDEIFKGNLLNFWSEEFNII